MLDILNSYLGTSCTPELHAVLKHSDETIKKLSNFDFDAYFFELIMTDDTRDEGETLIAVEQGYRNFMHQLLQSHGVSMEPDTHIEMLSKLLEGISILPTYGNVDELHSIVHAGYSTIESFATLMNVVTSIGIDEIMIHCREVSAALIKKVGEITKEKEEVAISEEELLVRQKHIRLLKEFSGFVQREELSMMDMVKEGMPVGYPFKVYADYLGRRMEQMTPDRIAHELYAMALCSVDGINNPRQVIGANINNYVSDLTVITKVDIIVNDLMVKLNSHG